MTNALPWVISLFYITAGYLLVAGVTAASVMVVARKLNNKIAYGALALLAFAGVGYQLTSALYYQATTVPAALALLTWQMDFASIGLIAAYLFIAFESIERAHPLRILAFAVALALAMVVGNRLVGTSLHFDSVGALQRFSVPWLSGLGYLDGTPGYGARIWYGTMAVVLVWGLGVAHSLWRQVGRFRAGFLVLYIAMLAASLGACLKIDWGLWQGVYSLGFALTVLVLIRSISLVMASAKRSQKLALREREMHREIIERRRAEGKLQRLSQVFMQEPAPNHIVDLNGNALLVNAESVRFLRGNVAESPRVNFFAVLAELGHTKASILERLARGDVCEFGPFFFAAGKPVDALFLVKDAWLSIKLYPIQDHFGMLQECVVRLEDVTERQFVEQAINTISTAVSTETGHAFFSRLAEHLARLLNKKYVVIGLSAKRGGELHWQTLAAAIDGELTDNVTLGVDDSPLAVIFQNGFYAVERRAYLDFPWQTLLVDWQVQSYLGVAITDEQKQPIGALLVLDDKPMEHIDKLLDVVNIFVSRAASELQRLNAEKTIRKMAFEDQLTHLPNRAALTEHVATLLQRDVSGAFIQLDLDHFKTINDALGHDIGDEVIKRLGRRLRNAGRQSIYVSRLGGDEFALVVTDANSSVKKVGDLARQVTALMEHPVEVGDHLLDVGCTMGIVIFPQDARTVVDVFRHADIALHKAKQEDRGEFQLFTPAMRDEVSRRASLERGLRDALTNQELALYFQPQVDSKGCLIGAEVLLRWLHPERGSISPSVFIPVAEETGLINPIGEWILQSALSLRKRWLDDGIPFSGHLSINVSAWQFARPDFVATTIGAVLQAEVPPSFITLEITETAVLSDVKDTIEKMAELRRFGISIALDDFGTGYSSLAYLRDLPLDLLKIDKAFVDVLETQAQEPLVESMIAIGKHMGLKVVAEGVQTQLQLERLQALGCNAFQGYLFAKPLCESDFAGWLHAKAAGLAALENSVE